MTKLTADIISAELLKEQSGVEVYNRGLRLFRTRKVVIERVLEDAARCRVKDNETYQVSINLTEQFLYLKCDCLYAAKGYICEHDVAGALAIQEYLRKFLNSNWQNQLSKIIKSTQFSNRKQQSHPFLLFFSLQNASTRGLLNWKVVPYYLPLLGLPKDIRAQVELIKDAEIKEFFKAHPRVQAHLKTPYQSLPAENCINCTDQNVLLANILSDRDRNFGSGNIHLFEILRSLSVSGTPIYIGNEIDPLDKIISIVNQPADLRIHLSKEKTGLQISACINLDNRMHELSEGDLQLISYEPFIILFENFVFRFSDPNQIELLKTLSDNPFIFISEDHIPEFLERFYLPLANQISLTGDVIKWEVLETEPKPRIYLYEKRGEIQAELRYAYGDYVVAFDSVFPEQVIIRELDSWKLIKIIRNPSKEEKVYKSISSKRYGLKRVQNESKPGFLDLRARTHPVDFLLRSIPLMIKDGFEVYGEDRIQETRVNRNKPTIGFNVSSGIDWFDLKITIKFGDTSVSLRELRRVLKKKEHFIKLSDGTIGEIPQEWIDKYKHLVSIGEEVNGGIRLNKFHVPLIDRIIPDDENNIKDAQYKAYRDNFKKILISGSNGTHQHSLPEQFQGELRPYQRHGYDWLHFLREANFGGCLADDMGLGKTIQTLVFLQSIYENGKRKPPSLIVVPKSLIANWQREAGRFVPDLRILEYTDTNRSENFDNFNDYHMVMTTYGIMLRDAQKLKTFNFHYIILDESQTIKNPSSQTSRAARNLVSDRKLVLTGTPVENSTIELWSQFAFLNPGLLGSLDYFKREFSYPIEKKSDGETTSLLKNIVSPFILRRTKDQVAPELPPRSERVIYSDMEPAQRKLYDRTKEFYRNSVFANLGDEGLNGSRIKILEGLLRLRQICNHPVLIDENFRGESGKLNLLNETLETLRSEGHKALIFSQFVQMLTVIRKTLDKNRIPYTYLDGQTQNRQEIVDQFQENNDIPFFLISLKAGGLGLNLTAADYVLHIDPWWNPAVEMQATDRTHRIGQEKPVFVYKLITRDSVEEKIIDLQDRKRDLVDQIITPENGFFKHLTRDEVESLFS